MRRLRFSVNVLSAGLLLGPAFVLSQDYPTKPIRNITAAVGGNSDFDARQIAQGISGPLGQPVIVDNRAAVTSADAASKAAPDGYTLLVSGAVWAIV